MTSPLRLEDKDNLQGVFNRTGGGLTMRYALVLQFEFSGCMGEGGNLEFRVQLPGPRALLSSEGWSVVDVHEVTLGA